jgi:hypothetical protein
MRMDGHMSDNNSLWLAFSLPHSNMENGALKTQKDRPCKGGEEH